MMDTVLNLGLNDESVEGLAKQTGDERFAFDSYRRFIAMYGRIVLELPGEEFDSLFDAAKELAGTTSTPRSPPSCCATWSTPTSRSSSATPASRSPRSRPSSCAAPSRRCSAAGTGPAPSPTASRERIPHDLGTAVNVQAMVFGNRDDNSGTGVGFTRDPATGAKGAYGDFLVNAQGEDVVAGIRNTEPLSALKKQFPKVHAELLEIFARLEAPLPRHVRHRVHHRAGQALDAPDPGRQAHRARPRCDGGRHGATERPRRSPRPRRCTRVTEEHLDAGAAPPVRRLGLRRAGQGPRRRSPGPRVGRVYFTADDAAAAAERGEQVILVRNETSPEDVHGMLAAEGILTARGGLVSHAAVVARGWGKPAVVGAEALRLGDHQVTANDVTVTRATGSRSTAAPGMVVAGQVPLTAAEPPAEFDTILAWADDDPQGPPRRAGQRRQRPRRRQRPQLRRRGHRAVPHRAHVPRRGPPARSCGA